MESRTVFRATWLPWTQGSDRNPRHSAQNSHQSFFFCSPCSTQGWTLYALLIMSHSNSPFTITHWRVQRPTKYAGVGYFFFFFSPGPLWTKLCDYQLLDISANIDQGIDWRITRLLGIDTSNLKLDLGVRIQYLYKCLPLHLCPGNIARMSRMYPYIFRHESGILRALGKGWHLPFWRWATNPIQFIWFEVLPCLMR